MSTNSNRSVRVLVVDRDEQLAEQVSLALVSEGYSSEWASNASQGLTRTRHSVPSVMVVDTDLEGCSGFDLVRAVRDEYPLEEIPVIFLSNQRGPEIVAESRRAGGLYFLSKPIDIQVLLELVDKSLWMPHLVKRHVDAGVPDGLPRAPRVLIDAAWQRIS